MWIRFADGEWRSGNHGAERAREVKDVALVGVMARIRSLPIEWDDGPFPEDGGGRAA